jgi:transmembrane sensor
MLIGSAALAAVVMGALVVISRSRVPVAKGAGDTVAVSRPERRQLADGSIVELNARAEIEVHFSALRRDVTLKRGEAHFQVAKDRARPFVVATDFGEAKAVGTAFSVGLEPASMAVLVTEGIVAVQLPRATLREPAAVAAGNAVVVPATPDAALRVESVPAAEIARRLAWRAPHLHLANTTLADVVAAFNREGGVQLTVPDAALARLRFTGEFRADRADEFVHVLETHYEVQADHQGPNLIVLHRRQ